MKVIHPFKSVSVSVGAGLRNSQFGIRNSPAFTLLELLVVIAILGILAALTVPALKNIGQSQAQVSAARQLLDDVARARQLALGQRTTVYMVFVPANFWQLSGSSPNWWIDLSVEQKAAATNLLDKQCSGYTFVSLRSVGDQPGRGLPRYLAEWKSLPDGSFIATNKFNRSGYSYPAYYPVTDYSLVPNVVYPVSAFACTNNFPFPTATNFSGVLLPYIAFNYLGQLTVDGVNLAPQDEYIPLAQGNVSYGVDANKNLQLTPADFAESPPGNSTNSMFTLIRIDRLTGRAAVRQQKVQ